MWRHSLIETGRVRPSRYSLGGILGRWTARLFVIGLIVAYWMLFR